MSSPTKRNPWSWIPSLYFAEGLPYIVVMQVSVLMYKRLGISNTDLALYTSWLYLPWVIKPLWSPIVDTLKTKRFWIVTMQLVIGAGLAGVALTLPGPNFFKYSLAFLWLLAFSSATHDIAADGFYMLGLSQHDQAWFVGIRSTFYRLAMITGQGVLVMFAGGIEANTGLPTRTIEVHALADGTNVTTPQDTIAAENAFELDDGPLRLLTRPAAVEVSTQTLEAEQAGEAINGARAANIANGFYTPASVEDPKDQTGPSWWSRRVSRPLARQIEGLFGSDPFRGGVGAPASAGNVGIITFGLSSRPPPDERIVVNLGMVGGDKSIKLVEGERFTFSASNWDKPFQAVVQLDPKLKTAAVARFEARSGNIPLAWSLTFYLIAGIFVVAVVYHRFILPRPADDRPTGSGDMRHLAADFVETFVSFVKKPGIGIAVLFLLFYRFSEAQLVKLAAPFLVDAREAGGLALTTGQVGFVYGTVGVLSLTVGGILGGLLAAQHGLKRWLWPMVIAMNVPNVVYVYLSIAAPTSLTAVNLCVAVEQFGYGFGFTAFMLYMIYVAEGRHKTAHFAICTGLMAAGMMIPGMFSGWVQDIVGYQKFFLWILIATIPGFLVTALIKVDPSFGKKQSSSEHSTADSG